MNDAEFQKLLNAEPPVVLKAGWIESLFFRNQSLLRLDNDGFTVTIPFSKRNYVWSRTSSFRDDRVGWGLVRGISERKVFFDYKLSSNASFIEKLFFVKSIWLPYNYGLAAFQLAQLLNHWRERALAGK